MHIVIIVGLSEVLLWLQDFTKKWKTVRRVEGANVAKRLGIHAPRTFLFWAPKEKKKKKTIWKMSSEKKN